MFIGDRTGSRISSLSTLSSFRSSSSSSSSASASASPSPLKIIQIQDVHAMISSKIQEKLSFQEFTTRVSSVGPGKILMDSCNPSREQLELFTSPRVSIDIMKSVASDKIKDSEERKFILDIDQSVLVGCCLESSFFGSILSPDIQPPPSSIVDSYDDLKTDIKSTIRSLTSFEPFMMAGESRTVSKSSRSSSLSTSANQLRMTMRGANLYDAECVVDILNKEIPNHLLMAHTLLDTVLKNVREYDPKSKSKFDQFSNLISSDFVTIDLGHTSSANPLLVAVRANVLEVKQAVKDLVSAWRNRSENSNSSESTSAEKVCNSFPSWGSGDKFETVSLSLQSLQLGTALLVLARREKLENFVREAVHIFCESYNQKRSAMSTSFQMYG